MDEQTRIQKDLHMFEENLETVHKQPSNKQELNITALACQYYEDAKYYYEKQDFFTAFGCINYAHGLLDAIVKF